MNKPFLIINDIEIFSKEELEEIISDFPEESKIALRLIFVSQTVN